jgi:hypothetical protein
MPARGRIPSDAYHISRRMQAMRKFLLSSAALAVLVTFVSLLNMGGCGDNLCNFGISSIYNGANFGDQDSEWECRTGGVVEYTIAFFADGTGTRSDIGDFTWVQTECKQLQFAADSGESATLRGLQVTGGIINGEQFGQLKFNQVSDDLGDFGYTCELIVF